MKKLISILSLTTVTLSTSLFANQNNYFYASANVGIFQADFDNSFFDQTDIIAQNIVQTAEQHGYTGGIAVGYRHPLNQVYFMGGELSANIDGHAASFQSGAATAAFSDLIQIKRHADLTLVPGIMLNDTLAAYLKLGLSYASVNDNLISPAGFTPTITTINSHQNALGFIAGLGLEKWITEHAFIFTEANYHDYGTVSFPGFQNFSATYSHSSHIYSLEAVIGASYKFDI